MLLVSPIFFHGPPGPSCISTMYPRVGACSSGSAGFHFSLHDSAVTSVVSSGPLGVFGLSFTYSSKGAGAERPPVFSSCRDHLPVSDFCGFLNTISATSPLITTCGKDEDGCKFSKGMNNCIKQATNSSSIIGLNFQEYTLIV